MVAVFEKEEYQVMKELDWEELFEYTDYLKKVCQEHFEIEEQPDCTKDKILLKSLSKNECVLSSSCMIAKFSKESHYIFKLF